MSETGWIFARILSCSVKHLESQFNNIIALGKRKIAKPFRPCLSSLMRYNVRDIVSILPFSPAECVPSSIIMRLVYESTRSLHKVSGKLIRRYLHLLNYQHLLSFVHEGIKIDDFHLLEKANPFLRNIPLLLAFPFLKNFDGFCLNAYRISYHEGQKSYTIYPRHLSKNHSNPRFFAIDLLIDSSTIRPETYTNESYDHVLVILNLPRLVSAFSNTYDKNRSLSAHVCRQCLTLHFDLKSFRLHSRTCSAYGPGNIKRRVSNNRFLHRSTIFSKKQGKYIPHVLQFDTKNLHTLNRPFTFLTMDTEATNEKVDFTVPSPHSKVPGNAVFEQRILAASYVITNVFPNFPLPANMQQPRCLYKDKQTEQNFYLTFFGMLRSDIKLIHNYELDVISQDKGIPNFKDLTLMERFRYIITSKCEICLATFGRKRRMKNNKLCTIKKALHHEHAVYKKSVTEPDSELRLSKVICTFCNLQLTQAVESPKKTRVIFLHNATRQVHESS